MKKKEWFEGEGFAFKTNCALFPGLSIIFEIVSISED